MGWEVLNTPPEEYEEKDVYDVRAEAKIIDFVYQKMIVTEREVKVHLEDEFFPWVVGRALKRLLNDGKIKRDGYPGRKPKMGTPTKFYLKPEVKYWDSIGRIGEKRNLTRDVNGILTRTAPAGMQAEDVFERAFISMGFEIKGRDVSTFHGKTVTGIPGKTLPNLDFVLKRSKKYYGVDIKNWIKYERETRNEVILKVRLAMELDIIPVICARYVDEDTIYKEIISKGGLIYRYKHLILPTSYRSLGEDVNRILGYPTLCVDELPNHKWAHLAQKVFKIKF